MNVLVTGGAGYVGTLLCKELLDAGHKVTIVDNFLYGYDSVLHIVSHPDLSIIKRDIRDNDHSYLTDQDVIFHLAAISGYPACEANPNSAQLINVRATKDLVASLSQDQLLIYASTTSLYGDLGSACTEETPIEPRANLYAITKYEAEKLVMDHENSISLRWATVFGVSPRMRAGLILNDFVDKAVNERAVVVYSGQSKRTFMHVRDSVRGYMLAIENANRMRGEVYNMGSARMIYSKIDLTTMIKKYVDFEVIQSKLADKDIRDFIVSFDKVAALGYDCTISIEEGIRELVKLYSFYTPNSFIRPI